MPIKKTIFKATVQRVRKGKFPVGSTYLRYFSSKDIMKKVLHKAAPSLGKLAYFGTLEAYFRLFGLSELGPLTQAHKAGKWAGQQLKKKGGVQAGIDKLRYMGKTDKYKRAKKYRPSKKVADFLNKHPDYKKAAKSKDPNFWRP